MASTSINFEIKDIVLEKVTVLLVDKEENMTTIKADGIFGIAPPRLFKQNKELILDILKNKNLIQNRVFSLFLNNKNMVDDFKSQITIGGYNP